MVKAYVLICTQTSQQENVVPQLKKMPYISDVYLLDSVDTDLLAITEELHDSCAVEDLVNEQIRPIKGILSVHAYTTREFD